jgi:hypothetical protein
MQQIMTCCCRSRRWAVRKAASKRTACACFIVQSSPSECMCAYLPDAMNIDLLLPLQTLGC